MNVLFVCLYHCLHWLIFYSEVLLRHHLPAFIFSQTVDLVDKKLWLYSVFVQHCNVCSRSNWPLCQHFIKTILESTFSPSLISTFFAKISSWDRQLLKNWKWSWSSTVWGWTLKNNRHVIQLIFLGKPRPALEDNSPFRVKSFLQYHVTQWRDSAVQFFTLILVHFYQSHLWTCLSAN